MGYNIYLDDLREPYQTAEYMPHEGELYFMTEWLVIRNYKDFVKTIEDKGLPDLISFDHDFVEIKKVEGSKIVRIKPHTKQEKNGMDCAKWLVEYCMNTDNPLPKFIVHSQNPAGKENIQCYLENAKKHLVD